MNGVQLTCYLENMLNLVQMVYKKVNFIGEINDTRDLEVDNKNYKYLVCAEIS